MEQLLCLLAWFLFYPGKADLNPCCPVFRILDSWWEPHRGPQAPHQQTGAESSSKLLASGFWLHGEEWLVPGVESFPHQMLAGRGDWAGGLPTAGLWECCVCSSKGTGTGMQHNQMCERTLPNFGQLVNAFLCKKNKKKKQKKQKPWTFLETLKNYFAISALIMVKSWSLVIVFRLASY